MRGGLERWKRGVGSDGVRQAVAYAFDGRCDAAREHQSHGVASALGYSDADTRSIARFIVTGGGIDQDRLDARSLARWVDGADPDTGEARGRVLTRPDADLFLDATMNMPKSYSLAVLLAPELRDEFDALQDRIRDRTLTLWQQELNARRGAGGLIRERIARLEVVELRHERSRALDPHIHRHLWLGVKVLGEDGKWSNVDSRVAMKLHTLVNAEGDLASRTDPAWIAALACHGYTLDPEGEIAELAHLVRPLSRRSNQIEANRGLRLAQWRRTHPGERPDHAVLAAIDRWAWAQHRPGKPDEVEEAAWQDLVRSEIAALDARATLPRSTVTATATALATLDRDLLAATAVADADRRSAGCGGRFSRYDVRAGAVRALAASGVVADRDLLEEVIEDVTARALEEDVIDFLDGEARVPSHVKQLMSLRTAQDKLDLAERLDRLNEPGQDVPEEAIGQLAADVLDQDAELDPGQTAAAAAVAGTNRIVTVTGPAGTGKTTLLKVARRALQGQRRAMIVVAPTRKAATVAGRDIGTAASSLHALLVDHGYRFTDDATGWTVWTRLAQGDVDPVTGATYRGPRRYPIQAGDRIVVDEAGMVELQVANALAQLALDTGASIAMIGDHLQALPVGHSGAMAAAQRRSGSVVELTAVHRFRDPDYAALSLRLRNPAGRDEAVAVARELAARGHVETVASEHDARERMVAAWLEHAGRGERIALVTATNAEAQQINDRIQQERLDRGQLDPGRVAVGQHGQSLLVGDIVQTRRNDNKAGVDNRATWTVIGIRRGRIELASVTDSGDRRTVTTDYAAEHVHLAYASTVHGIQGETVYAAYTGPGVDAAGLYVGMTRGRAANTALAVARTPEKAIEQLAETMLRGQLEVTLDDGRRATRRELDRAARDPQRQRLIAQAAKVDARVRALRTALREVDARAATHAAAGHARADTRADLIQETAADRDALLAAFAAERARKDALLQDVRVDPAMGRDRVEASANSGEHDPFAPPAPDMNGPMLGL
jgi:nucleoside-triphosphatase THEP1